MSNKHNNSNNKKMYTSTPSRNSQHSTNSPRQRMQFNTRPTENDVINEEVEEYNQEYYTSYNNAMLSKNNEFRGLPVETYDRNIPGHFNENELQLNIETDTEDSYTNYKTANTSYLKSNFCHPVYFDNVSSNQSTVINTNLDSDTGYTNVPLNLKEYCKPGTSRAFCSNDSSSICSKNKKIILENPSDLDYKNLEYLRELARQEYDESCEEFDDYTPAGMQDMNENPQWDPNYSHDEISKNTLPYVKPHISYETYPSATQYLKKTNRLASTIPLIQEDDYQQVPKFERISESMDPMDSYSNEKSLDPIYLKYSTKEDLTAKSDSINMLSVVISTVMLLASKSQIPQNYITWTLKYLKCIKNKKGQHPPNIKKLQKMLTVPTGTGQWNCMDFLAGKNPGKRIDLTKKRKNFN